MREGEARRKYLFLVGGIPAGGGMQPCVVMDVEILGNMMGVSHSSLKKQ